MSMRCLIPFCLVGWMAVLICGCGKTETSSREVAPASAPDSATATQDPLIASVHWVGKKQLAADSNATNLMAIWKLPESAALGNQTLDKLSAAPWRLWQTAIPVSNAPTALLRPLLVDLIQEESYLEIHGATNQPREIVLAVRLDATQDSLWQTNLTLALESLIGARPTTLGTKVQVGDWSFALSRSSNWTLFSGSYVPASTPNLAATLLATIRERISTNGTPLVRNATNGWLEASFDLRGLNEMFNLGWQLPPDWPKVALNLAGVDANVRTTGELTFPRRLPFVLEPWQVPTNIIHDPLVSFTAMRGVSPWIGSWSGWQEKDLGPAPNQVFFWAQSPALWQHFLTYPVANATNHVRALGDWVLREWNPIFQTNKIGKFDWATNKFGLVWRGVPFFRPVIEPARFGNSDYALIGLFANNATNQALPDALLAQLGDQTNLVYYDWEITGPQVTSWTQMGQLSRLVFGRSQLSRNTFSLPWLRAITPILANATTALTQKSSDRISLKRSSTCGLTAVELQLLAEWLESPDFPIGLHTLRAPQVIAVPMPDVNSLPRRTNSVPAN